MSVIKAKELEIDYLGYEHGQDASGKQFCWEFENGLIMFESEISANWFFPNRGNIELCGLDVVEKISETGKVKSWGCQELAKIWGQSIEEFDDASETDLVRSLVFQNL